MVRLSKLTDYAIVLLTKMASAPDAVHTARELTAWSQLPITTVSKVLKLLASGALLTSIRGKNGGYALARPPSRISVASIVEVMEGPVELTECSSPSPGQCQLEHSCPVRGHWRRINSAVVRALEELSLAELAAPVPRTASGRLVSLRTAGRR